jgi:hypothetical protein
VQGGTLPEKGVQAWARLGAVGPSFGRLVSWYPLVTSRCLIPAWRCVSRELLDLPLLQAKMPLVGYPLPQDQPPLTIHLPEGLETVTRETLWEFLPPTNYLRRRPAERPPMTRVAAAEPRAADDWGAAHGQGEGVLPRSPTVFEAQRGARSPGVEEEERKGEVLGEQQDKSYS